MFCLNDGSYALSLEEISFHRGSQSEVDPYDYFSTEIKIISTSFDFKVSDVDVYIFHLNELIDGIRSLIKGESDSFAFSLRSDIMDLKFKRCHDGLSYILSLTLTSSDDGNFSLKGIMGITTDSMNELYHNLKYFMSAYE